MWQTFPVKLFPLSKAGGAVFRSRHSLSYSFGVINILMSTLFPRKFSLRTSKTGHTSTPLEFDFPPIVAAAEDR